jgi:hypothetical protein
VRFISDKKLQNSARMYSYLHKKLTCLFCLNTSSKFTITNMGTMRTLSLQNCSFLATRYSKPVIWHFRVLLFARDNSGFPRADVEFKFKQEFYEMFKYYLWRKTCILCWYHRKGSVKRFVTGRQCTRKHLQSYISFETL